MRIGEVVKDAVFHTPLLLLSMEESSKIGRIDDICNYYLPYSTGFEIECSWLIKNYVNEFMEIPHIIDVSCDNNEKRFRIPNGLNGLICLFEITKLLKKHCSLNLQSGIHYHIDMTNTFDKITNELVQENKEWILKELDNWNYKGSYNRRDITFGGANWLRFSSEHKTAEFRLGEMTFDYSLLIKRIIHCNRIVKKINKIIESKENRLIQLQSKLDNLQDKPIEIIDNQIIKKRQISIYNNKPKND